MRTTFLIDPSDNFEDVGSSTGLTTEEFNRTVPTHLQLSSEEEIELDELLLESGVMEEVQYH